MKGVARFFTLFWIIYFPTCIAYNDLPRFNYIDEVMLVVIAVYTLGKKGKKYLNNKPWKEFFIFVCILLFYTYYSLLYGENVGGAVYLDFIQEIRPYTVIYCTWILNPQFTKRQKKWMLGTMVATLFSWVIYHPETISDSEVEFPVLGQLAICTGTSWYLFTEETKRNRWIALGLVMVGMLAPKFKFIGEVACFTAMIFFVKQHLRFRNVKTMFFATLLTTAVLFITWERFDAYYVTGWNQDLARPATYRTSFKILKDYFPFGPGMGTFACNGAWRYYSPLYYKYELNHIWGLDEVGGFICDAYYPTLAQFGVVGVALFIAFWRRRLLIMNSIKDMKYYRVTWIAFFCLAIEQTADSSFLSGKGMGYCMLLALCFNANRNMKKKEEEEERKKRREEESKAEVAPTEVPAIITT